TPPETADDDQPVRPVPLQVDHHSPDGKPLTQSHCDAARVVKARSGQSPWELGEDAEGQEASKERPQTEAARGGGHSSPRRAGDVCFPWPLPPLTSCTPLLLINTRFSAATQKPRPGSAGASPSS